MFDHVRRIVVFLLGVGVVVDSLVGDHANIAELAIGAVMIGVLPISDLLDWRPFTARRRDDQRD